MNKLREITILCIISIALVFFLALLSFHADDPSWTHVGQGPTHNLIGVVGAWISDIALVLFGYVAYVLPFLIAFMALLQWKQAINSSASWIKISGLILFIIMSTSFFALYLSPFSSLPVGSGGVIGAIFSHWFLSALHITGATILLLTGILCGLTLCLHISWFVIADYLGRFIIKAAHIIWKKRPTITWPRLSRSKSEEIDEEAENDLPEIAPVLSMRRPIAKKAMIQLPEIEEEAISELTISAPKPIKSPVIKANSIKKPILKKEDSALLSLELLNEPKHLQQNRMSATELAALSQEVEQRLLDFGIKVEVVNSHPGPVITRFELLPAPGIKASRISNLATDLARSLSVVRVRVVEVIPGKSVVGLEIPNRVREVVYLKEVLESSAYQEAKSAVSLALGKDIAGAPVVVDLAKMPHLLVAGTTGSGKSVGLNAMLLSLLYKATPTEVRMIMVDPKMLELSIYEGIPHLLTPVVTDMREAANALRWCVAEMEKRYRLMASQGVRNIAGYNEKIEAARKRGEAIQAPEWYASQVENGELITLPMIVVVIDEFADMIMVVGKKVEQLIARIAQKARAAGIHLILATQRPSVNVITGLIKANIPTRIAFQVSSKIDSRTILDQQGAQQLLGHGDMLYLAPGAGVPVRVHGAFVADDEVHRVVAACKEQGEPNYIELGLQQADSDENDSDNLFGESSEDGEQDKLYDQAVQIVMETRKASISGIQRRLKIGYNRAARLVETMEEAGIVGPMEQNGSREILVKNS